MSGKSTGARVSRPARVAGAARGWAEPLTHSPSSRFQIGARALISSMISRAPANASARWGADTAIATDASDSGTVPTRCSAAAAHRPWRSIASATIRSMWRSAIGA